MSINTLWLPDSEPASLEAILLSTVLVPSPTDDPVRTETVAHYRLSCPTARSPENDACRAASIYPADVYHSAGPVWGGTTTYAVDDSTTTWVCTLGRSGDDTMTWGHSGECTKTIISASSTRSESAEYDPCYVEAHHVPIIVTEGANLLPSAHYVEYYQPGVEASDINAAGQSAMQENGCPTSRTIMFEGAVETSTAGGDVSDTATSNVPETDSGSATSSATPTGTGEAAAESSEGSNSGAALTRIPGLTIGLVVIGILGM